MEAFTVHDVLAPKKCRLVFKRDRSFDFALRRMCKKGGGTSPLRFFCHISPRMTKAALFDHPDPWRGCATLRGDSAIASLPASADQQHC